jgi:glutathione S-transferase
MLDAIPAADLASFQARVAELPREKVSGWAAVWSDAEQLIEKMEAILAEHAWIVGDEYSILDMMAFAQVHDLPKMLLGIVNEKMTPKIIDWLGRISSRPAVSDALSKRRSELAPVVYFSPGN